MTGLSALIEADRFHPGLQVYTARTLLGTKYLHLDEIRAVAQMGLRLPNI